MAQKTTVTLIDDLDGSTATETVGFGLDGTTYEIDLSTEHAEALRDTLADYIAHARRHGRPARGRSTNRAPARSANGSAPGAVDREQNKAVRDWARQHGYTVSDRGRIPSEITEAYHRGH